MPPQGAALPPEAVSHLSPPGFPGRPHRLAGCLIARSLTRHMLPVQSSPQPHGGRGERAPHPPAAPGGEGSPVKAPRQHRCAPSTRAAGPARPASAGKACDRPASAHSEASCAQSPSGRGPDGGSPGTVLGFLPERNSSLPSPPRTRGLTVRSGL